MARKVEDLHVSMTAAIRNPDNKENLILVPVTIMGLETSAICWVSQNGAEVTHNPLSVMVTPEIFALLKLE